MNQDQRLHQPVALEADSSRPKPSLSDEEVGKMKKTKQVLTRCENGTGALRLELQFDGRLQLDLAAVVLRRDVVEEAQALAAGRPHLDPHHRPGAAVQRRQIDRRLGQALRTSPLRLCVPQNGQSIDDARHPWPRHHGSIILLLP